MIIRVKKIALSSSLLWPLLSWGSAVNNTPGDIVMQGELIEASCNIDPDSRELWINFGEVSAREITPDANLLLSKNFNIKLVGCTLPSEDKGSASRAQITMMGSTVDRGQLLQVNGDSEGFGIQLKNSHGEILKFNTKLPDYTLLEGRNSLEFTATLVAYQKYIKAGEFAGVLRFRMDYF
ncbi:MULTISPECIES: fimbrial protein [Providencia]|uniref:fimbrial protein n=1 Tax=Providencia TaxID=586 RepID=UPI0019822C8D|nr:MULTISPECIES: fimbrial protein [Providencia]HEC8327573.1 type 1 fimbrial protein [Providencia rettgeri]MBN4864100.1 type 1 fimbrial protein [Providencia stuartii]MBN4873422.1 type 1 fimbrial protein [Providencia stuartii]MBN4877457.1 type 1 fimbrial protein [Providencia stuartii]MBN4882623.1 type 1 fimbrial protein [Providencia stuartii]